MDDGLTNASRAIAAQNGVDAKGNHDDGDTDDVIVTVDPLRVKRVRQMDVTGSEDHVLEPPEGERMLALLAQLDGARARAAQRKGARGGKGGRKRRDRGEAHGDGGGDENEREKGRKGEGGGGEDVKGGGGKAAGAGGVGGKAVAEAHGEWVWQGVMSQLTSAQEELRVIVDLVNAVESGAEGLAVSGVSKPKQHAAEMSSELTARLAGKLTLLQDVGGGLLHAAARLTQQVSDDAPFYTALQRIQHRWKVKRTHPALAPLPTPLSTSSSTAAGFAADVTVQSLLLSLPHAPPLPASMPLIPATSLPFTSLRLDRDKQGMLRAAPPEGQPIRRLHVSVFGREAGGEYGEDGGAGAHSSSEGLVGKGGEEEGEGGGMAEGKEGEEGEEEEGGVGRAVRQAHELLRAAQRSWFDWQVKRLTAHSPHSTLTAQHTHLTAHSPHSTLTARSSLHSPPLLHCSPLPVLTPRQLFESLQSHLAAASTVALPLASISSSSLSLSLASSPACLSLRLLSSAPAPPLWSSLTRRAHHRRPHQQQTKRAQKQGGQGQGQGDLQEGQQQEKQAQKRARKLRLQSLDSEIEGEGEWEEEREGGGGGTAMRCGGGGERGEARVRAAGGLEWWGRSEGGGGGSAMGGPAGSGRKASGWGWAGGGGGGGGGGGTGTAAGGAAGVGGGGGGGSAVGMGVGVVELLWGAAAHRAKKKAVERCLFRM
ncbi:unnamed protein product, partial [Closterium sp. NIES-53]